MSSDQTEIESLARAQLPYRAEYCKTSRAKCKKCGEPMKADSLKLANMVKSRFHDGHDAVFYDVKCFFQVRRPASVAEIRNFEILKFEDQRMLEKAIETNGLSVLGESGIDKILDNPKIEKKQSSKAKKRPKADEPDEPDPTGGVLVNYSDFLIDYAKSSRAVCISCEEKIMKDEVRVGKLDYASNTWTGGAVPRWHHVDCFAKDQEKLNFFGSIKNVSGFKDLEEEDRKMVRKKIRPLDGDKLKELEAKRLKALSDADKKDAGDIEEEKKLKEQSDAFFALREQVNEIKRSDLELILDHMKQKSSYKSPAQIVDAVTDVLMFGPLKKCPKCKQYRGMVLRGGGYICTLGPSDDQPCSYETRSPKRDVVDLPQEILDRYPYFYEDYAFEPRQRIFSSKFLKAVEQKEAEQNNLVQDGAPLEGLNIGLINWKGISFDREKVKKKIITLGGTLQTSLDKSLFVILTSQKQLDDSAEPKVEVAKALDVPFAKADFLFEIETKEDVVPKLNPCLLGDWDGNLKKRYKTMSMKQADETKVVKEEVEIKDA